MADNDRCAHRYVNGTECGRLRFDSGVHPGSGAEGSRTHSFVPPPSPVPEPQSSADPRKAIVAKWMVIWKHAEDREHPSQVAIAVATAAGEAYALGSARGMTVALAAVDARIANMRGGPRLAEAREIRHAIADAIAKETT